MINTRNYNKENTEYKEYRHDEIEVEALHFPHYRPFVSIGDQYTQKRPRDHW